MLRKIGCGLMRKIGFGVMGWAGMFLVGMFLVSVALIGASASADDQAIGFIKTMQGSDAALISPTAVERPAELGAALFVGDTVRTGRGTSVGLTLKDDSTMAVGPNTELVLEEYLFEPARGDLRLGSRLGRGTLQYVSGGIARLQPDAVSIATPTGTIGVRGTHLAIRVSP